MNRRIEGRLSRLEAKLVPRRRTVVVEVPYATDAEVALAQLGIEPDGTTRLIMVTNFASEEPRLADPEACR